MSQSEARPRSYRDLARLALADATWPAESRMGERSLAAIFSKLDRERELEWLSERVGVQRVLAHTLGVPLDDVRGALRPVDSPDDVRRLRLDDLRFARAIDLVAEPPPPGLPAEAVTPAAWGSTFWHAPSGAGRSLAGRFLQARGLCTYLVASTLGEALAQLPARGALFIELTSAAPVEAPPPPELRLCVAGPRAPAADAGWRVIESPPPSAYLAELVHWAAERLPGDGRFDAVATLEWLRGRLLGRGLLDRFGSVLGFIGLADELGLNAVAARSAEQLAQRVVRERLTSALDPEAPHANWLKKHGYETLVALGKKLLSDSDLDWDQARPFDAWLGLVPQENQRETDLDWMRVSLSRVDSGIRSADIDKAARHIPPGAFRVVRGLEQAQLLRRVHGDGLCLRPQWLSSTLRRSALAALVEGSPFEWGEALLRGHAATSVAEQIALSVEARGDAAVEPVVELDSVEAPAHAAALEMAFRAVGFALLAGVEFSADTLEALWDSALELLLELPGELPRPRIEYPEAERCGLLGRAAWTVAALAVSEQLGPRSGRSHPLLRPWRERQPSAGLRELYDSILREFEKAAPIEPWQVRTFSLIHRLRGEVGAVRTPETPHPLEQPAVVVDEVVLGVLSWSTLTGIATRPLFLQALRAHARERGTPFADVARAAWNAWDAAGRPSQGAGFLAPDAAERAEFWPHVPAELLTTLLDDPRAESVPYDLFAEQHWQAFLTALEHTPRLADDRNAFARAPESVLGRALELGVLSPALGEALWQRAPELAKNELDRALERRDGADRVRVLLRAAHDAVLGPVFAVIDQHQQLEDVGGEALHALREFLHGAVAARRPGYRDAYARLAGIERHLADARPRLR